jgi:AraC-like DNA-binding protein
MKILSFPAHAAVSSYVAQFLFLQNKEQPGLLFKMVPRNYPAFLFTCPDMQTVDKRLGEKEYFFEKGNIYYSGLGTRPAQMHFKGSATIIVALLKPWCAGLFLKQNAIEMTDIIYRITDMNERLRLLNEQLWEGCHTINHQIALIENYLLQFVGRSFPGNYIIPAIEAIRNSSGCVAVKDLEKAAFTCNRNLLRHFHQHVGVCPKQYSAMIRFSSFMKDYIEAPHKPIELLAQKYQYYDLSHLNKEANRFVGVSPSHCITHDQTVNKTLVS